MRNPGALVASYDSNSSEEDIPPPTDPTCRICGIGEEKPEHILSDCMDLAFVRLSIFGKPFPSPPYVDIKVYQLVAFLKIINLPSLEMKPYLEQYNPTDVPEEARPTPSPPIVDGAEQVSSDEDSPGHALRAAEAQGGRLLHNYLLTSNKPPLQDPKGAKFY